MSSDILKNDIKPDDELSLQIGERDGIRDKLKRMCRQNPLAAVSAIVILIFILMYKDIFNYLCRRKVEMDKCI